MVLCRILAKLFNFLVSPFYEFHFIFLCEGFYEFFKCELNRFFFLPFSAFQRVVLNLDQSRFRLTSCLTSLNNREISIELFFPLFSTWGSPYSCQFCYWLAAPIVCISYFYNRPPMMDARVYPTPPKIHRSGRCADSVIHAASYCSWTASCALLCIQRPQRLFLFFFLPLKRIAYS